ncbi:N/A [soil metagenome]
MSKIRFSIFIKLSLVLIGFVIIVDASLIFFSRYSIDKEFPTFLNKYPVKLNSYILDEISSPPDSMKASQFVNDLMINIRFDLPKFQWTSDTSMVKFKNLKIDDKETIDSDSYIVKHNGRSYIINDIPGGHILISPMIPKEAFNTERLILSLVIFVFLIAIVLYLALRWIFNPVKTLTQGIEAISDGDFDTKISVRSSDEFRRLAEEINKMTENIKNSIKTKESLLVDVSHEMRSPLTRIKIASEFITEDRVKKDISDDVKEMEIMTGKLLDTYRKGNMPFNIRLTSFDIVKFVNNILKKYHNNRLKLHAAFPSKQITADRNYMDTIFSNLIENALKYSKDNIEIKLMHAAEYQVVISIKDHGIGIPNNEMQNIFEPFYRIDKSRRKNISGYGLGLNIVKKIVDSHKGTIEIRSEENVYTEFIIKI